MPTLMCTECESETQRTANHNQSHHRRKILCQLSQRSNIYMYIVMSLETRYNESVFFFPLRW